MTLPVSPQADRQHSGTPDLSHPRLQVGLFLLRALPLRFILLSPPEFLRLRSASSLLSLKVMDRRRDVFSSSATM
jgi:hypothetical protein